jgi:hypothetical protein
MLAMLLVAAIGVQLVTTGAPELPDEGVGRVKAAGNSLAIPRASAPPSILAKPLFSPTRAQGSGPGAVSGSGPLGGASPVGMMQRGRAARLFLKLPDGSILRMAIGGSYHGWRLAAVTEEGAIFAQGKQKTLVKFGTSIPDAKSGAEDEEPEEE